MSSLTEVQLAGEWHAHFYEDAEGRTRALECSAEDIAALRRKGAGAPDVPGRWLHSSGRMRRFDTPSGLLEDGCYCRLDDAATLVAAGGDQHVVRPGDIVDGELRVLPARAALRGQTAEDLKPR
jgi:hypothetical protein